MTSRTKVNEITHHNKTKNHYTTAQNTKLKSLKKEKE